MAAPYPLPVLLTPPQSRAVGARRRPDATLHAYRLSRNGPSLSRIEAETAYERARRVTSARETRRGFFFIEA